DMNWSWGPPSDATPPNGGPSSENDDQDDPCEASGSIIECENRILREEIPITGTPWTLGYTSERAPGHRISRRIHIPLSSSSIPNDLLRIEAEVQVAGRRIVQTFPAKPNQATDFEWDGMDAMGRVLQGSVTATIDVRWYFKSVYQPAGYFASGTPS